MCKREQELAQQIAGLLAQASAIDAAEDQQYGAGKSADQLPTELARAEQRVAKIRAVALCAASNRRNTYQAHS